MIIAFDESTALKNLISNIVHIEIGLGGQQ